MEKWKPIPGYEGHYEVSDRGRVRSFKKPGEPLVLANGKTNFGYDCVVLCKHGACKTKLVHQLVLTAFIGPRPPGKICCHANGDKTDNRPENLRWDTYSANETDKLSHGTAVVPRLAGERHPNANLTDEAVRGIRAAKGKLREIAQAYGCSITVVWNVRAGKAWTHVR